MYRAYEFVKRVIESCENHKQTITAGKLLRIFLDKYMDYQLYYTLRDQLDIKRTTFLIKVI